jgi:exopolysaccharide production protein ExoZ
MRIPDGKIESIEALRFFAALLVVLYHANFNLPIPAGMTRVDMTGPLTWFQNGNVGVDIFFVISGFVMYTSSVRRKVFDAVGFLRDRFWRIFPVLWAALLAKMALEGVNIVTGLGDVMISHLHPSLIAMQFLLIPLPSELLLVLQTWTLSLEMLFYLVFALGFLRGGLKGVAVGVLAWYAACIVYVSWFKEAAPAIYHALDPVILEFLYGAIIGRIYMTGRTPFGMAALVVGLVSLLIMTFGVGHYFATGIPREYGLGIPAALLVYGLTAVNFRTPRILLLGGQSSYVLYLFHNMIMGVTAAMAWILFDVRIWDSSQQWLGFIPVVVAVIVAGFLNVYLENPFQKWRRDRKRAKLAQVEAEIAAGHGPATAVRTKAVAGDR